MSEILKNFGTPAKISGVFQSLPLEWYSPNVPTYSRKLLRVVDSKPGRRSFHAKLYIFMLTILLIIFQAIADFMVTGDAIRSGIPCSVTLMVLSYSYFDTHICRIFAPQIASFVNGLLQFDHLYEPRKQKFKNMSVLEKSNAVYRKLVSWAEVPFPLGISLGSHWHNPWKTSLAAYWLIPKTCLLENGTISEIITLFIKVVVMLYNSWVWIFGFKACVFVVTVIYTSCIEILLCNIET